MNITIASLSLSSLDSFSPLFCNLKLHIEKLSFRYYVPTLILNPIKIHKSEITNGIGSIIISKNDKNYKNFEQDKFTDLTFDDSNFTYIENQEQLIFISDCKFIKIAIYSNPLIFHHDAVFYMTKCIFNTIQVYRAILDIDIFSTTITHICFSNLTIVSSSDGILRADFPGETFFKFIYSTIYEFNDEYMNSDVFTLNGRSSFQYQCVNISITKSYYLMRLYGPLCCSMFMNTFYRCESRITILMNIQEYYPSMHSIGYSNFIHNKWNECLFQYDMHAGSQTSLENCVIFL